jgi:alpha-beta hydrolase superfamily lysophospholipase
MGLITDYDGAGAADEYEAVALPVRGESSAVFVRRSARPTRRAVLHLHELTDSLAPDDLVRWYNERGFHFYLTDVDATDLAPPGRRRPTGSQPPAFSALDAACGYLQETDGIDAIILSAQGPTALVAAQWCDARPVSRPVEAVILSNPDFGRDRIRLDITCPVLVISAARPWRDTRRERTARESVRLGQHVTWLQIDAAVSPVAPAAASSPAVTRAQAGVSPPQRRRLFDEMGRWLGAYMYGQVRDQLL